MGEVSCFSHVFFRVSTQIPDPKFLRNASVNNKNLSGGLWICRLVNEPGVNPFLGGTDKSPQVYGLRIRKGINRYILKGQKSLTPFFSKWIPLVGAIDSIIIL